MPVELQQAEESPFRERPRHRSDVREFLMEQLETFRPFAWAARRPATQDGDLAVPTGEAKVLVDESGAGKSMFNLLLSSEAPDMGAREVGDHLLQRMDISRPIESSDEIMKELFEWSQLSTPPTFWYSRTKSSPFQAFVRSDPSGLHVGIANVWFTDALEELEQVDREAAEEGLPPSSELAKRNARHILNVLAQIPSPAPSVYPTEQGGIAILFQNRRVQGGVLILCEQDGSGACFSTISRKKRRARYDDASDLPGAFVISELKKLRLASR